MKRFSLSLLLMVWLAAPLHAAPLKPGQVPEPLQPWIDWVLYDVKDYQCPFIYNNHQQRRCAWPAQLELQLRKEGGAFQQQWQVYQESWLPLPGNNKHWPQEVTINGKAAVVQDRRGLPMLKLDAGQYRVAGKFAWQQLPESLQVPADVGLLQLHVNGQRIQFPDLNNQGQLWLRERDVGKKDGADGDSLTMQVYRNVRDHIPLQVETQIQLDVSGTQREVVLGTPLLAQHIPWSINSPLPARLEPDGQLRMQVRPGHWVINVVSRHPDNIQVLAFPVQPGPWPAEEVWVFSADTTNRLVEVTGVASVDPRQTKLPPQWQNLPAYRLQPGDTMTLNVIRRGDPEPEPDRLSLNRKLWLDFAGGGYTVQDRITGTMTRQWRLEAQPELSLGRVVIDGQPQFITSLPDTGRHGVEVRRGSLNLGADSRLEGDTKSLPAIGWAHDFQSVSSVLHLPPGWTLFSATGMDNVPATWINRWTLLDLFMVLILSIAVMRMWNWQWGVLALVTLTLTWHQQPLAPQYIWAHVLIAIALLRVLKKNRFQMFVRWYRNISLLALILMLVPFMVDQVRVGIYPQLAHSWVQYQKLDEVFEPSIPVEKAIKLRDKVSSMKQELTGAPARVLSSDYYGEARNQQLTDPEATIQTGPGLPVWTWNQVKFEWNGPVQHDQQVNLVLLSPTVNMLLNFLRVLLVVALFLLVAGIITRRTSRRGGGVAATTASLVLVFALSMLSTPDVQAQQIAGGEGYPSDELLGELKNRLLEAPECLPQCAQSPRLQLNIDQSQLQLRMEVHTEQAVAVPLPSSTSQWLPDRITVNGKAAADVYRDRAGTFWIKLDQGTHQLLLAGPLPARTEFQLPLPLTPKQALARAEGWSVDGIHEDGQVDRQLKFTRLKELNEPGESSSLEPGTLPAFVRIERTLLLGLDWRVETRVVRATPPGTAVVLEVPMLEGESLLTENVRTQDGKVLVNMAANERQFSWQSIIPVSSNIELKAPNTTAWTEIWYADVSPIWHMSAEGIPVVHHTSRGGNWLPEWQPWPGETVTLSIVRPEGVPGRTLTIDSTQLTVSPGKRATDVKLAMTLRSSQGGQHSISLPEDAELQQVVINGDVQPIRQEGNRVTLPLVPGSQYIELTWRGSKGLANMQRAPAIDLGIDSVNARSNIKLGRDRWVLFTGGPLLGPAVLYWGVLIIVILVAYGLGRVRITPIKTWQWFLLGVGLSPVNIFMALVIVGWLLALGLRGRIQQFDVSETMFNVSQLLLGVLTVISLSLLFFAIQQGLLGVPDMQVGGNQSTAYDLYWYQDRSAASLPQGWVFSVPLMVYRVLMLLWALWLAFTLLKWLKWSWQCFSTDGLWRKALKPPKDSGNTSTGSKETPTS